MGEREGDFPPLTPHISFKATRELAWGSNPLASIKLYLSEHYCLYWLLSVCDNDKTIEEKAFCINTGGLFSFMAPQVGIVCSHI